MNSPNKIVAITLLTIAIAAWIAVAMAGTATVVYKGAYLLYKVRSPSLKQECAQIRPGMNLQQVLAVTTNRTEPLDQGFVGQEVYFSRENATCHVAIDATTLQVTRAYLSEDIPIR